MLWCHTVFGTRMSDRKWRETKQQPMWWPDLALVGCRLVSLHFQCDILAPITVIVIYIFWPISNHNTKLLITGRVIHRNGLINPLCVAFYMCVFCCFNFMTPTTPLNPLCAWIVFDFMRTDLVAENWRGKCRRAAHNRPSRQFTVCSFVVF